jgi:hypothetical protein
LRKAKKHLNKESKMKKMMLTLFLTLILSFQQKSHALIGLVTANPAVISVGAFVTTIGIATGAGIGVVRTRRSTIVFRTRPDIVSGVIIMMLGLIVLDETAGEVEFSPISRVDFDKMAGVSHADIEVFNSEVSLLNSIHQSIALEIATLSEDEATTKAQELWSNYLTHLSAETIKVGQQIAIQAQN